MALSGVAFDVGNNPAQYQAPMPDFTGQQTSSSATKGHTYNNVSGSNIVAGNGQAAPKPASTAPNVAITIEKFTSFDALLEFYKTWKTLGIAKTASRAVLPTGCMNAPKLMVISDIPDDHEDRYGETFSSPAHMAIRMALKSAGFAEQDVLFSYLSKWRTPAKRPLTAPEKDICMQLLSQEIALANPDVILSLGESTIRALSADSQSGPIKNLLTLNHANQVVNKNFTVYASPKGEFLLKNPSMKKSFWFSLLDLASRNGV